MPLRARMLCPCVHVRYAPARMGATRARARLPRREGGPGGDKPVLQTSLEYQVKYNSSYLEIVFARKLSYWSGYVVVLTLFSPQCPQSYFLFCTSGSHTRLSPDYNCLSVWRIIPMLSPDKAGRSWRR